MSCCMNTANGDLKLSLKINISLSLHKKIKARSQRGIRIKKFGGKKRRGVVATHSFKAGHYITVYTGRLMTAKEGYEAEQSKGEKDGSFQFFFPFRNQMYW